MTKPPERPNLLFIYSDQQRYDSLPTYGADWVQAPNLERLADQSFVFENVYVSQPVCTPARSTIMTGLYPHTLGTTVNNIPLPPDALTIAQMIGDDYVRGKFGRWHLGDEPVPQHGFEEWIGLEDYSASQYSKPEYRELYSTFHHYLASQGFEPDIEDDGRRIFSHEFQSKLPAEHWTSTYLADSVVRFVRGRNRPFLLYVSLHDPHGPYTSPFDGMYDPDDLPVGPSFLREPEDAPTAIRHLAARNMNRTAEGLDLSTEGAWREMRASYYGNVTFMDGQIGRMLDALEREGIADDTIVVFTSEHGDMLGDHQLFAKRYMYEPSARVPLFVRVPWLSNQRTVVPGNISQIDLVPTLLDLMGQPIPDHLQGRSRVAVLRGEENLSENDVVVQQGGDVRVEPGSEDIWLLDSVKWRSIITADRWKLNLSPTDSGQLFDMNADPHELRNLIDLPEHRERVRNMAARLRAWQRETDDIVTLPEV